MDRWKAAQGRGREKRKIRREKIRRERVRRKKMQMREKVGKSRNTMFFQWFVAPESQLARWAMRDENLHAVVARSTFRSQNVQSTPCSDHFWKLRCRKSARRCGAKHISKSKCTKHTSVGPLLAVEMSKKCTPLWREAHFEANFTKHTSLGPLLAVEMSKKCTPLWREAHFEVKMYETHQCRPLLAVEMSKKCTPLWREAHFEVKMYKTPHVRATFGGSDVEKVHAVVARSTFRSENVQNTACSRHFWRFGYWKSAFRCGAKHISKSKCTKHHMFGGSDVEKVRAAVARSTFPSQNVQNTACLRQFWKFGYYRRKFRSQTSDNMDRWKAEQGRGREKRKIRRKKIRRERVRRKKMQMREKVGKSRNTVFFQWFVDPEGRKVGSLKRRVRSQLARWEMKICTPLWREAHFDVKMYKAHHARTTFGSWDVEKVHAVVARSTFRSQNVQNTPASDHFWQLRCRKSARRCGAKRFTTPHYITLHYTPLHYAPLHYTTYTTLQLQLHNYTPLHSTTLNYTTLHYITLHYTPLHYNYNYNYDYTTTLQYAPLHEITLHYITLHYTTFHYTPLHYTTLHYTTLHWMTLHHR